MSDGKFKNIFIFVSDALRYDYVPQSIAEKGVIPTLAPSLHTPTSFTSFFTARSPENHGIRGFFEYIDKDLTTAWDFFPNHSFWDGEHSSLHEHIFGPENTELDDIEEPFIRIERAMETHLWYGEVGHNRNFEADGPGQVLYDKDRAGELDIREEYQRGAEVMEKHFFEHIQELKDRGIYDETLVILTSDHGELLRDRYLFKNRYDHNLPPLKEIVQVPTVFYNTDVDIECMRLIDVIPTALAILGKEGAEYGDGVDARNNPVKEGRNIMKVMPFITFDTKWRFKEGEWQPTTASRVQRAVKTLATDVGNTFYSRSKALEKKIERRSGKESDDLEEIDF